jgi:hypothetical protein
MLFYCLIERFYKVSVSPISDIRVDGDVKYVDARMDKDPNGKGRGA